jgi:hypothetical protein
VVRYALEPLVYEGPAEGAPQPWKLRSARELLALKICDMACGSGAFLVAACRYMAERLVEAWAIAEEANPGVTILPEGDPATGSPAEIPLPKDAEERRIFARRLIAQRCLYGIDKNQQAVEMAKLSLWLLTLDKDRPFTFLDHAIKCGDSLLGVTTREQVEAFDLVRREAEEKQIRLWQQTSKVLVNKAASYRKRLESSPVMTPADLERKEILLREAEDATSLVRIICDLLAGAAIASADGRPLEDNAQFVLRRAALWRSFQDYLSDEGVETGRAALEGMRPEGQRLLDAGLPAGQPFFQVLRKCRGRKPLGSILFQHRLRILKVPGSSRVWHEAGKLARCRVSMLPFLRFAKGAQADLHQLRPHHSQEPDRRPTLPSFIFL